MPTLQITIESRQAKQAAEELRGLLGQVGAAGKTAGAGMDTLSTKTTVASRAMRTLRASVMNLYTAIGGLGLVFAVRNAIRTMSEFEDTMATLRGVAVRTNQSIGAQREQYELLESTARKMGATTRFTASQAAEGLLFLARAGFSVGEAVTALPATLNLAQAGNLALGEAADYASNVLKQFNLSAKDTTRVVDAMVIVSNRANTDVRQLAEALKYAGPLAEALGVSVEETSAAVGALSDAGIQATMAGTGLRRILGQLQKDNTKVTETLRKMGLESKDVDVRTRGLSAVMRTLGESGLTAGQALDLFTDRGGIAALVLARSADSIDRLTEATKDFAGEASRMAAFRADTLAGKAKALASAWQELSLAGGDTGLLGIMKDNLVFFTLLIQAIGGVEEASRDLKIIWEGVRKTATGSPTGVGDVLGRAERWVRSQVPLQHIPEMFLYDGRTLGENAADEHRLAVERIIKDSDEKIAARDAATKAAVEAQRASVTELQNRILAGQEEIENLGAQAEAQIELTVALRKYKDELGFIVNLGRVSEAERDRAIELYRLESQLRKAGIQDIDGEMSAIKKLLEQLDKLNSEREAEIEIQAGAERYRRQWKEEADRKRQVAETAADRIQRAQLELSLAFETEAVRRKSIALWEMERMLAREGIQDAEKFLKLYDRKLTQLENVERLRSITRGIGDAFGSMTERVLVDFQNIGDAFKALLKDIQRALVQELIAKPIAQSIAGLVGGGIQGLFPGMFGGGSNISDDQVVDILYKDLMSFSRGAAFSHGNTVALAAGDILTRPTYFPMAGMRRGLGGEAGPEGLLPLGRDSQGRLGVRMVGGQSGGTTINQTFKVYAQDANSFRKSERQILGAAARRARGAM